MTENLELHRVDAVTVGACDEWHYRTRRKCLPLSAETRPSETATSLCSRLSGANGLPRMRVLCRDFLISHADLCNGEAKAVTRIAELAGADPGRLLFHTPCLIEPGRFELGRDRIEFTAMLRNGGQVCPLCIAEDECRDPRAGPYQRDIWQIAAVRRCRIHGVVFVRPKFPGRHSELHDFVQIRKTWVPAKIVHVGTDDTALEDHLLGRIKDGPGKDWIDGQAFHVVWLFSEALGLLLTKGSKAKLHEQDAPTLIRAGAVGFEALRSGLDGLEQILTDLMDQAGSDRNNIGKIYAPILTCLLERRRDPEFNGIRRFVRSFILLNFRVPPGTSIVGEKSATAQIFTALTASQHYDVPLSVLNRQLRMLGMRSGSRRNQSSDPTLLMSRTRMEEIITDVRNCPRSR